MIIATFDSGVFLADRASARRLGHDYRTTGPRMARGIVQQAWSLVPPATTPRQGTSRITSMQAMDGLPKPAGIPPQRHGRRCGPATLPVLRDPHDRFLQETVMLPQRGRWTSGPRPTPSRFVACPTTRHELFYWGRLNQVSCQRVESCQPLWGFPMQSDPPLHGDAPQPPVEN